MVKRKCKRVKLKFFSADTDIIKNAGKLWYKNFINIHDDQNSSNYNFKTIHGTTEGRFVSFVIVITMQPFVRCCPISMCHSNQ